jgi:hypothetical protein
MSTTIATDTVPSEAPTKTQAATADGVVLLAFSSKAYRRLTQSFNGA